MEPKIPFENITFIVPEINSMKGACPAVDQDAVFDQF